MGICNKTNASFITCKNIFFTQGTFAHWPECIKQVQVTGITSIHHDQRVLPGIIIVLWIV